MFWINRVGRILIVSLLLVLGSFEFYYSVLDFNNNWYWIVIAIVYTITINDIFSHRIASHYMFKIDVKTWTYKILCFLSSIDLGYGPVRLTVLTHQLHHIHADDGPEDVMNWRHWWYATTIVSPIPAINRPDIPKEYTKKINRVYKDIINDPWTKFCHQYAVIISGITLLFLFLVFPIVFFKIFCMGRFLLTIMTGLAGFCGHIENFPGSYRNYNTNDTSSNNLIFHYMFLGLFTGMLQNNHHGKPKSVKPNKKWFEIDTSYPIVLFLKHMMTSDRKIRIEKNTS